MSQADPIVVTSPKEQTVQQFTKQEIIDFVKDAFDKENIGNISVVTLESPSGTLTDSEYELLKGNDAIIKSSTQYYYKDIDSAIYLVYKAATRVTANSTINERIEITKATKGFEYLYDSVPIGFTKSVLAQATLVNDTDNNTSSITFEGQLTLNPDKFYIIAFNGTFILTPVTTTAALRALGVTSAAYNSAGSTKTLRYRIVGGENSNVTIYFSDVLEVTPGAYLIEVS